MGRDVASRRPERHANADFTCAPRDCVGEQPIEPDRSEQRAQRAEETGQCRDQPFRDD
jgi:hypothetical protein